MSERKRDYGEGSYEGTRRYDRKAKDFAESGRAEEAAEKAKKAVEGPEKDELERAEEEGRSRGRS
jgi:hypothetical protein